MYFLTLHELREEVNNLARLIKAPKDDLPTYGKTEDLARPHLEVDHNGYHYVVVERGHELERKTTKDLSLLLFWIFESVTNWMAFDYEVKNRIETQDCRRIAFKKQIELIYLLNPKWAVLVEEYQKKILKEHPYDDLAGLRSSYCRELRQKGYSEAEIDKMANERYPEEKGD